MIINNNMNKITKLLFLTLFVALIIPQVALASWWNPFSWFSFFRYQGKTEVLETRIKELEEKIASSSANTITEVKKQNTSIKNEPQKTLELPKATIKQVNEISQYNNSVIDNNSGIDLKDLLKKTLNLTYDIPSLKGDAGRLFSKDEAVQSGYNKMTDGFADDLAVLNQLRFDIEESINRNNTSNNSIFLNRFNLINTRLDERRKLLKNIKDSKDTPSQITNYSNQVGSSACVDSKNTLNSLNSEYASINNQYNAERERIKSASMSISQSVVEEGVLQDTYGRKLADIAIKQQSAQSNVSIACGGVIKTPVIQNNPYTPTNTYCNVFSDSISCKSYNW